MAQVDITINGRVYGVACGEGEEPRVRDLAAMIDTRVRQLAQHAPPGTGETHFLVLASIMLADELSEAQSALAPAASGDDEGGDDEQELLVAAVDHLTDRIAVIADRLERA